MIVTENSCVGNKEKARRISARCTVYDPVLIEVVG